MTLRVRGAAVGWVSRRGPAGVTPGGGANQGVSGLFRQPADDWPPRDFAAVRHGPASGGSWPIALGAAQPSGAESRALARRPIVGPPRRSGDLDGPAFRPGRLRIWPRCSARRRPSDRRTAARQWGGSARQRQGRLPGRNPPNETKPPAAELGSEQTPNRLTDPQIERGPRRGPDGLCVSSTSNPREHRHPASRPRSRTGAGCRRRRGRARRGAGCRRTSCGGRRTSRGR